TPPPPPTRRWSCVISLTRSGRRASPRTPTSPTACSSWTRRNPGDGYGQGQGPHDPVRCRGAASATDARAPGGAPRRETTRQSTPSRNLRRGNQFMDNRVSPRAGNPDVRGHEDPAGPDDFADHPPVADCRDCGGTGRYVQQWATITWDHEQRGGEYPLVLIPGEFTATHVMEACLTCLVYGWGGRTPRAPDPTSGGNFRGSLPGVSQNAGSPIILPGGAAAEDRTHTYELPRRPSGPVSDR